MRRLKAPVPILALAAFVTSGCSGSSAEPSPAAEAQPSHSATPLDARTELAGLAAAAKDRHFRAGYLYRPATGAARTVTVVLAADGSWRVEIPGGALGGQVNLALAGNHDGLFQCRTSGASRGCVRAPDGSFPAWADPRLQHPFVDWLDPLTDRQSALSVAPAPLLADARGSCFSVEGNTAALAAPVDPGTYCYDPDGTLTGAKAGFGTLVLTTPPSPAPEAIDLPAPVTTDSLLAVAAPAPSTS